MKRVALILLAALPAVARAELVDIKWQDGAFAHKAAIAPRKFLEVCGKLTKGDTVTWSFAAGAKADFNIHYHVGKDVVYPENRKGVESGDGTLAVAIDQDYCWMWSNKAEATADLSVKLVRVPAKR